MLKSRDHNALLIAIVLSFCTIAATVTYVSTAQTQKEAEEVLPVKRLDLDDSAASVESANVETEKAKITPLGPVSEQNGDQASSPKETERTITIIGRALDERDGGRPNAVITLRKADGATVSATSDKFGNFRFETVADGQQVVLSAGSEPDPDLDLKIDLKGETRVFWRTPDSKTKSGK